MPSSSDITHSGHVSSSDSDNPRSSADCEGSSSLERDRAAAITLPVRTRRNAPRKPTHQPKGVYEVTEIDLKSWAPTKPDKARMRFRSVCGFVGRARLNINLPGFRKADTETRRRIVREIMDHFNVPEQWRMQVEHAALKKARDAWRNWKHVLYKKYLSEGKDPIPAYPQITKADWAEFKRVRATKEFAEKSFKQSELQKKNIHPHRMGVAGYYGMKLIWEQEDKEAVAAGGNPAFSEIRGERARDYLRARAKRRDDGTYYFENARDAKLYEVMLEASKIPGRFYRNSGPCDILSIALDTKEPPGRARGIGVNVPHKRAFTLSKEERLSMKKARSEMKQNALFEKLKKEIYPAVRKDVEESMMMQKTLTLTDSQQMGGEAGMEDAAYCATTLHKSSCASADPSDTETAAARDDAISDLSGMKDRLKGVLTHYEGTLKCATAWVCPPFLEDGLFLDNVPLKPGCVKCYVTEVKPGFNEFALKNVLGDFDEQRTLGETLLHHIQWPRKEIEFIDEIPEAPPRATTVAPQPVTLSLPQQLSRADASTCDQPARLCGVQAMSSSAPKQPVARPTTADDAPPVQMPAAEAAGGDPAAAHAQQTNLVEQTAKQSDASEPPT